MKTSEFIAAAEDEIRKGWCRHFMADHHGNVCVMGAFERAALAAGGRGRYASAMAASAAAIAEMGFSRPSERLFQQLADPGVVKASEEASAVAYFNDLQAEDIDEVLAVLDKARLRCEEAGD